ncbi:hypothetical protein SAMN05880558_11332 [Aeromonas sp. RU39B]|uniref:hypothetical protein n=1 Tax=Aeromonas sp. RU39B TaxID=1907416 RepID=UPI00095665A9|nr:hypothetical protein [Aeromonas sp. RU39B]SIR40193.1 hypothetical protein SAMN05880558_11332 [Aeromonas sp. RU39B]
MATTDLSGMGITSSRPETQPEQKQVAPNFDATNVNDQLSSTLNSNSLLMRVAKSQGQATANQRGLGNSSIGTEAAQRAMVDAALPIAQQNAQSAFTAGESQKDREHALGVLDKQAGIDKDKTAQEVVANTHGKYLTAVQDAINSYNERYAAVMADSNITAANKTTLVNNMKSELNSSLNMYKSLYSNISTIRPDWSSFPTITLPGVSLG